MKIYKIIITIAAILVLVGCLLAGSRIQSDKGQNKQISKQLKQSMNLFEEAKINMKTGNLKKAREHLNLCLKTYPHHSEAYYLLSGYYYRDQEFKKALLNIKKAKATFSPMQEALLTTYDLYIDRIRKFRQNLVRELTVPRAVANSGTSCTIRAANEERTEKLKSEISRIDQILNDPSRRSVMKMPASYAFVEGNIYMKLGQNKQARTAFLDVLKDNPAFGEAYNYLAELSFNENNYDEALHFLSQAELIGAQPFPEFKDKLLKKLDLPYGDIIEKRFRGNVQLFIVSVGTGETKLTENTYIVFDDSSKDALIIDPGIADERIKRFIQEQKLKVGKILNTHGHYDHIGANRFFADLYRVSIMCSAEDSHFYMGDQADNKPDEFYPDNGELSVGSLKVKIIKTPGHSTGSVCLLINNRLFSGDTLFLGSIGKVWGKNKQELMEKREIEINSIKTRLFILPEETVVFPGHGLPTQIVREKKYNPILNK